LNYLALGILVFVLTWGLLRIQIKYARQLCLMDVPDDRKLQHKAMPSSGGLSMIVVLVITSLSGMIQLDIHIVVALSAIGLIGLLDDRFDLSHKIKFIAQILVVTYVVVQGYGISNLYGFFGVYELPIIASFILSLLIGVGLINTLNLIDGVDGLCASYMLMFLVACSIFGNLDLQTENVAYLSGCIIFGFLMVNFSPAKIYMGDTGSLVIGLLVFICLSKGIVSVSGEYNPRALPFLFGLLLLPVADTFRLIITRILNKKSPFKADRNHFHHRLLQLGMKDHFVTLSFSIVSIGFGCISMILFEDGLDIAFILAMILIYVVTISSINLIIDGAVLVQINHSSILHSRKVLELNNKLFKNMNHEKV